MKICSAVLKLHALTDTTKLKLGEYMHLIITHLNNNGPVIRDSNGSTNINFHFMEM